MKLTCNGLFSCPGHLTEGFFSSPKSVLRSLSFLLPAVLPSLLLGEAAEGVLSARTLQSVGVRVQILMQVPLPSGVTGDGGVQPSEAAFT